MGLEINLAVLRFKLLKEQLKKEKIIYNSNSVKDLKKIKSVLILAIFSLLISISISGISKAEDLELTTSAESEFCDPGDYYWLVYDNVCPYCRNATKYIKQLDWEKKFKFISYRNPQTYKMFPKLKREECEKDPHLVTPEGEILKGYEVFRKVIDTVAATKVLNPILKNNFAEQKLMEIYEKMVEERSCYYNKTETCSIDGENHEEESTENKE